MVVERVSILLVVVAALGLCNRAFAELPHENTETENRVKVESLCRAIDAVPGRSCTILILREGEFVSGFKNASLLSSEALPALVLDWPGGLPTEAETASFGLMQHFCYVNPVKGRVVNMVKAESRIWLHRCAGLEEQRLEYESQQKKFDRIRKHLESRGH